MFDKLLGREKPLPTPVLAPQPIIEETFSMTGGVLLGRETRWNPSSLPNAHIVCIGASGSGKTQTLKALAYELSRRYMTAPVLILDFHGDQELDDETCFALHRASPHGVNLLAVNLDREGGGVSLQTIQVVRSMKAPLMLGSNQEGVLLDTIKKAYARRGLFDEQPETWTLEPPTFAEVRDVLADDNGKEARKLELKLASLFEYGMFSRPQPDFLAAHITRVDLSKLPPALQAIAAESLASQLMNTYRLMGEMEGKEPRCFLFIDEAKEMPRGSGSACDRIIADGRKYGLAVVLASQSERHLSLDVIANSSTKIVLPVDQTEVGKVARKFRFDELRVAKLKPLEALCRFGTHAAHVSIWPYYERRQHEGNA